MPVLQLNDQQFPLIAGTTRVGAGSGADVALPVDPAHGIQALIEPAADRTLVIRRASPDSVVRLNGILLGAEPSPLLHGDKVELIGLELRYSDDTKGGATQFVSASDIAALTGARRAGAARATAASGGRLVSLVDGKEYTVPSGGLVMGRDASCDVVLAQHEVSRRHAEIAPGEQGYVVRDTSANGVFVNGERVQGSHYLARADVLRVGSEEFRFYADVLPAAAAAAPLVPREAASAAPAPPPASADAPAAPVAREAPVMRLEADTPVPPVMPAAADGPVLATLVRLNGGPGNGERLAVRTTLAHVGRGAHNEVHLTEESVSEAHAELQRRDDGWYVVDRGSTNGTYVGGSRVSGERRLSQSAEVRFGGVKLRFLDAETEEGGLATEGTRESGDVVRAVGARRPLEHTVPIGGSRGRSWVWILAALVVAAAVYFVIKGRA